MEEELRMLKDVEKRIEHLEKVHQEVIENSNSLIIRWNAEKILYMNRSAMDFFGYREEDILGKSILMLFPQEGVPGGDAGRMVQDILSRPEKYVNMQTENVRKGGERVWIAWSTKAVRDERGGVEIISFGSDITCRVRAEHKLRQREEEFKTLVENSADIIARWDRGSRFLYISRKIKDITGHPPDQYIGKKISEFHTGVERAVMDAIRKAIETRQTQRIELSVPTNFGERLFEARLVPETSDREVRTVMGIGRDITELKEAQRVLERDKRTLEGMVSERTRKLIKAENELQRSRRLSDLGQLAATIAHELRNPLSAIQMANFNIKRKAGDERITRNIETIDRKIDESNQIIGDVLTYARIKPPELHPVRLKGLLADSADSMRSKLENSGACLGYELDGVEGLVISADAVQLKEVFANIIDNACDAVAGIQGRRGMITLSASRQGNLVTVTVIDNGAGMDEATLRKLMHPFFTTKSQGTGLGLTVSHQIVNLHEGSISIESRKGEGTRVNVTLPISH